MKEKLKRITEQYLREAGKGKIHHLDISVPGHDGRFWIVDASLIGEQPGASGFRPAIYFSVNPHSRKGRRIAQVIDLLNPFENYQTAHTGRFHTYYLICSNNSQSISQEVTSKIQALFPALDLSQVQLSLVRSDKQAGVE